MNMHEAIKPNINPERFYIQRKLGGKGLICVEEVVLWDLGIKLRFLVNFF